MRVILGATVSGCLLLAAAQALSADFPKSGEAEYDTYYVFRHVGKIDGGVGIGTIDDFTGVTRNVKGEGPFHDMSVHCLMHWTMIEDSWSGNGSCVETDRDGDNVFTTFDGDYHYIRGGTGKYKGISGNARYTPEQLHDTDDGQTVRVVHHKISWKIE